MKKLLFSLPLFFAAPLFAGNLPASGFTENKGQFAGMDGKPVSGLFFRANLNNAPGVFITDRGITYLFTEHVPRQINDEPEQCEKQWSRMDMILDNASIKKENVTCQFEVPGYSNYYYAHCPEGILYVKSYRKITFRSVYPGIDWTLYINENNRMEYDFIIHPGADPSLIKITYKGADRLKAVEENSELQLFSSCGSVFEGKLSAYEKESGKAVSSQYRIKENKIEFAMTAYDKTQTLVIDPPLLWSSAQGGSGMDYCYAIALAKDGTGQTCLTGVTDSPNFPVLNAYQGVLAANEDMFVQRLNTSGARVWSTYYGGANFDGGKGVGTDVLGNCYVSGYTGSNNFPVLNPVQVNYGGGIYDVAILKFNSAGVRQWATWYGGLGADYGNALCTDNNGTSYITGYTNSNNFPTVSSIPTGTGMATDAFIMKIDYLETVRWADYFGGNDDDRGRAVTLNPSGSAVYFTGSSLSSNLPTTAGVFQPSNANAFNAEDVFITRFDTSGQSVGFCTYWGGTGADFGQGIAVDATGNVYITGFTLSSDFPVVNPGAPAYYNGTIGSIGTHDAFIAECNPTATAKIWGTYYGGSGVDMGLAITWNAGNGIYVTGSTGSTNFPVQAPADAVFYQSTQGDGGTLSDFFIGWFYTNKSRQWSTYYGGAGTDEGRGLYVDASNNLYIGGYAGNDALVLKFGPGIISSVQEAGVTDELILFPQPVISALQLMSSNHANEKGEVEICDELGKSVMKMTVEKREASIDVSSLGKGIYFLRFRSAGQMVTKKFIKM